jgi:hypothetical protein
MSGMPVIMPVVSASTESHSKWEVLCLRSFQRSRGCLSKFTKISAYNITRRWFRIFFNAKVAYYGPATTQIVLRTNTHYISMRFTFDRQPNFILNLWGLKRVERISNDAGLWCNLKQFPIHVVWQGLFWDLRVCGFAILLTTENQH